MQENFRNNWVAVFKWLVSSLVNENVALSRKALLVDAKSQLNAVVANNVVVSPSIMR